MKSAILLTTMLFTTAGLSLLSGSSLAAACQQVQQQLAPQLQALPVPRDLVLNGYGSRTKLIWDVYLTALYLPRQSQQVDTILDMPGPKRLSLYFLREVPEEKLLEGWMDGFKLNQSKAQLQQLQQRLTTANRYFRTMDAGDSIHFDYRPDHGTGLYINQTPQQGTPEVIIPGDDFFRAILQIWIGPHPTQQPLKDCLLELAQPPAT